MSNAETRQTSHVDGRTLHLRRFGSGPAVVLLHESPRSSAVLIPLASALADRFTVFALDSPGFGLSDPLPIVRPNAEDFADAIVESLRALGLVRAGVYGTHTGAAIAIAMANRHPDFVSGVVLDGYAIFTGAEADAYATHYLAQFEPTWDGAHVARLWSRVRDQYSFFPWNAPGRGSRLPRTPPTLRQHTDVVRDLVSAGRFYAPGYEAAFRYDGAKALIEAKRPTHLVCRDDDLLFGHLDRAPSLPDNVKVGRLTSDRGAWAEHVAAAFAAFGAKDAPAPIFSGSGSGGAAGVLRAITPELLARCYETGASEARPLVLIPDLPGDARIWDVVARQEARRRRVIAIDPPGGGVSPATHAEGDPVASVCAKIIAALNSLGVDAFDIAGRGLGALLAREIATAAGVRVHGLMIVDPPPRGASGDDVVVEREPDWHGGHLLAAWYEARDRMLYRPWTARRVENARTFGPGVDIQTIHAAFVALVRADNAHAPLARALLARGDFKPEAGDKCDVVLQAGDADSDALSAAFRSEGARVRVAPYDDISETAVSMLRAR